MLVIRPSTPVNWLVGLEIASLADTVPRSAEALLCIPFSATRTFGRLLIKTQRNCLLVDHSEHNLLGIALSLPADWGDFATICLRPYSQHSKLILVTERRMTPLGYPLPRCNLPDRAPSAIQRSATIPHSNKWSCRLNVCQLKSHPLSINQSWNLILLSCFHILLNWQPSLNSPSLEWLTFNPKLNRILGRFQGATDSKERRSRQSLVSQLLFSLPHFDPR